MKNKPTTIILLSIGVMLIAPSVLANSESATLPPEELPMEQAIPRRIEGTSTYFEVTNSEYLNVFLQSTEEIIVSLESIPKTVSLQIEASTSTNSTTLTIEGLEVNTTYYKFEDSYKNETVFVSDDNGSYIFTQDLTQPHHVWFQPDNGTVFLPEDCDTYGTWDELTSTCTLTQDLTENVEITTNNITLDCNGHSIIGTGTGYGIYLPSKEGVVIKKGVVVNFSYGIYLHRSPTNTLTNNTMSNNSYGIYLYGYGSRNNILTANTAPNNYYGIYLYGSRNNTLTANTTLNSSFGILLYNRSNNNTLTANIAFNNEYGISLYGLCSNNILTENTVLNNARGIYICCYGSINNTIYHNNFIDNYRQTYIVIATGNLFDNGYPLDFDPSVHGGNYWSDYEGVDLYSGPNQDQPGSEGIGDTPYTFTGGQDNYPFVVEDGWEVVPPTLSGLGQFKSDGITSITESTITTESTVVFKALLNDTEGDQVKLQVELKEYNQPFNEQDLLEADFVDSNSTATIARHGLIDGQYHWQARAVDFQGNTSDWQEFGEEGNVDFEVKSVPLYTQVESPYPSWEKTREWFDKPYAKGVLGNYDCGSTIADCGCAITSMVMLGRYYDINAAIDDSSVDPANINTWLTANIGYTSGGGLWWSKAIEYLGFIDEATGRRMARLNLDFYNASTSILWQMEKIDKYVNSVKPVVAYSKKFGHYFIVDNKLAITYGLKDSSWYNTKTLNDTEDLLNKVRDYNNHFDTANLFSYLTTPKLITASIFLSLASPAELLIIDPLGRKLGKDPIAGISYNEIPDSSYTKEGLIVTSDVPLDSEDAHESKVIYIPSPIDGEYAIRVIGTDAGTYTLSLLVYDQNGQSKDIEQQGDIITDAIQEFELDYSLDAIEETEFHQIVEIDIKPGSYPNSINCKNQKGIITVAILTTETFDATNINSETIRFGPDGAQETHRDKHGKAKTHLEDVDEDGDLDAVFHFRFEDTGIQCGEQEAILTGKTLNGFDVSGLDSIRTVGGSIKKSSFPQISLLLANLFKLLSRLLELLQTKLY